MAPWLCRTLGQMDTSPWGAAPPSNGAEPYRSSAAPLPPLRPRAHAPLRAKELAAALAIVAAIDLALWGSEGFSLGGFGLALVFVTLPLLAFAVVGRWRRSPRLAAIVGLLTVVVVRTVIHPTVLTTLAGLALLLPFALALRARRAFVPEALLSSAASFFKLPSRLVAAVAGVLAIAARTHLGNVAIAPIAVPIALSAIFIGVFALANPLVAGWLDLAAEALLSIGVPPLGRLVTWSLAALAALALLRPACRLARGLEAADTAPSASTLSVTIGRNVFVSLNLVFLAYHLLDAPFLVGGRPPQGMTTQHYAHAGALWLTVALAMLTAVVGVAFRGALAHDARARAVRALAYVWIAQGLVLALGTYRRIGIHIAHTGLSNLRIVGILGTTLVVVGVILVATKLHRRRTFTWILRRQLDAFALTFVLFAVAPTHWISAQVNVSRLMSGEQGPLLHLGPQSREVESAAVLIPLLGHSDRRVREGVAALLVRERERLRLDVDAARSWRQRNLLSARALATLDASSAQIAATLHGVDADTAREVLRELAEEAASDWSPQQLEEIRDARNVRSSEH